MRITLSPVACIFFFFIFSIIQGQIPQPHQAESGLYGYISPQTKAYVIEPQFEYAFAFMPGGYAKVVINGKWGIINKRGEFLVAPQYNYLGWSDDPLWQQYQQNGIPDKQAMQHNSYDQLIGFLSKNQWGILHIGKGKVLIPANYDAITYPRAELVAVARFTQQDTLWGLRNIKNQEVLPTAYTLLQPTEQNKYWVVAQKQTNKQLRFGAINHKGQWIWHVEYTGLRFENGYWLVQQTDGNWKAYNTELRPCFAGSWQQIRILGPHHAAVQHQGRWGLYHADGHLLIDIQYRAIYPIDERRYRVAPFPTWIFIDTKTAKEYSRLAIDKAIPLHDYALIYQLDQRMGLLSTEGLPTTPPIYYQIKPAPLGLCIVRDSSGTYVMSSQWQALTPAVDSIHIDPQGWIMAQQQKYWAVYTPQGQQIIPFSATYRAITPFAYDRFAVRYDYGWGVVDRQNRWVIPAVFDSILAYHPPYWHVKSQSKQGLYHEAEQKWVIHPTADSLKLASRYLCFLHSHGRAYAIQLPEQQFLAHPYAYNRIGGSYYRIKQAQGEGVLHAKGFWVIDPKYEQIVSLSPAGIFTVYDKGRYALFDTTGRQLMPFRSFLALGSAHEEGLVPVLDGSGWGFISLMGNKRISTRYNAVKPFTEGMAAVKIGNRWGYIDAWENLQIQPLYEEAMPFENGYALVQQQGLWAILQKNGRLLTQARYDQIEPLPNGWWLIQRRGKKGILDAQGIERIPPQYDTLIFLNEYLLVVSQEGKWGLLRTDGFMLLPPMFDGYEYYPNSSIVAFIEQAQWQTLQLKGN